MSIVLTVGSFLINFHCAGQFPPNYGPPDTTPPDVTETYPLSRSLHFNERKISMKFSEYVDRRSVEQAVFFSPSVGRKKFDWGGKDVEIEFSDTLRPNTTYIMTLGTDVTDLHSIRMAKAFTLPFSTGNRIDSASIAGKVFDPSPEGVMIYAYDLQYKHPDTLNPAVNKPDYLTQTGKDGSFLLPYLRTGNYRVIAVKDEYRNIQYDRQLDGYGLLPWDVALTPDSNRVTGAQYRITREDTTAPFVSSVRSLDRNRISMRFSEVIDTSTLRLEYIRVFDTLSQASLELKDISIVGDSAVSAEIVTSDQEKGKGYRLNLVNLHDLKGNSIAITNEGAVFSGDDEVDTVKPSVRVDNITEGSRIVEPNDSIVVSFEKPLRKMTFEKSLVLADTSKTKITGSFVWWGSSKAAFIPLKPFGFGMSYTLKVALDSLRDFSTENHFKDSTFTFHFQTEDQKTLSSLKGEVIYELESGMGRIIVQLLPISADILKVRQRVLEKPGPFSFENIPEGRYSFFVFRDSDGNGVYSYGRPYPFQPAERFSPYTDTLKLRARWPLEGVVIRIKK